MRYVSYAKTIWIGHGIIATVFLRSGVRDRTSGNRCSTVRLLPRLSGRCAVPATSSCLPAFAFSFRLVWDLPRAWRCTRYSLQGRQARSGRPKTCPRPALAASRKFEALATVLSTLSTSRYGIGSLAVSSDSQHLLFGYLREWTMDLFRIQLAQ